MKKVLCFLTASALLCGCSMINPYQSEFSCPDTFKGKCSSVREVYLEDAAGVSPEKEERPAAKPSCASTQSGAEGTEKACSDMPAESGSAAAAALPAASARGGVNAAETSYNRYRSALYDRFGELLREPQAPIVAPPKAMRVLLLPYTGQDNEFYMLRYVYFFVDKPRWILGDSVVADGEEE